MPHHRRGRLVAVAGAVLLSVGLLSACNEEPAEVDPSIDLAQVDAVEVPELGACRVLTPEDARQPSNATRTVSCQEEHTAQTFAVGELPEELADAAYDSEELGAWAYRTCSTAFEKFLGADESLVLRSMLSWAWFRPSQDAWDAGARWYRCDVVGGGDESAAYVALPVTARGLLQGRRRTSGWCASPGRPSSTPIGCRARRSTHWRAVTTIKLGEAKDDYPGDRLVEVTTRDFCSDSVGAWLGYPVDYDFGYTWFHEAEWEAGNRRSVCWAKTAQ